MSALLYSGLAGVLQSYTFTYDMKVEVAPADEASAEALGEALGAEMLGLLSMRAAGSGAVQVVDPALSKANMRMDIEMEFAGQTESLHMVVVGDTAWMRLGDKGPWQKMDVGEAGGVAPGIDPNTVLADLDKATDVRWIEESELEGERVHHLRFSFDPSEMDLSSLFAGANLGQLSPEEFQSILEEMIIEGETWLGVGDLLPRQQRLVISTVVPMPEEAGIPEAKLRFVIDVVSRLDNFNEEIIIEPPTEE